MKTAFEARASTVLYRLCAGVPKARGVFLLPANICPVVPLALLAAGRRFEFVDLDPDTLCPDGTLLSRRLRAAGRPPVAGIVFARSYGGPFDAGPLFRDLKALDPELLVVDDRCLSVPVPDAAELDWQGADAVLFSTGYSKPVDLDYGGFAHLRGGMPYAPLERPFDPADLERVTELYKSHIRSRTPIYRDGHEAPGGEALARFHWLDTRAPEMSWSEYRERLAARAAEVGAHRARIDTVYERWIPPAVRLPHGYHGWRFQIRVENPERLLDRIFAAGLFASRHYFPSAVLFGGHACPVASELYERIVNLFNDLRVSETEAGELGRIVRRQLEEEGRVRSRSA